jgi:peptide/nickel transport system substrate-binding protein
MQMTPCRVRVKLTVGLLLATLSGCNRQPPPGPTQTTAEGPRQGGQVVVAVPSDISTLNEYMSAGEATEYEIIDLLFPALMVEQADYTDHPPSFAPRLAASWEFSHDNRTITFHLRSDARWSDGVPVTAEDVRFTYLVQKDPRVSYPSREIKDYVDDVQVVDEHTVRFVFSRVYPYQLMDANDGHIIPKHAWERVPLENWKTTDFESILVTCGPFRLASHTPGQTLALERDPGYWNHPRPYLDRLVFRIIPDSSSQLSQLAAGQVHLIKGVPPQEADRLRPRPDLELIEFPSRAWGFVAWNNRNPLFSDRRVRRALSMAINRQALVDTVYHGTAKLSNGPILSSMWANNRNLRPVPFDPRAATDLLAQAGWRDRNREGTLTRAGKTLSFDLLYPATNTLRQQAAVLIQADLARIGVRVRPTQVEYTAFMARNESEAFDASLFAWEEATKIDLTSAWSSRSATQGSNNYVGYSNPEVDRLIAAAREEFDYTRAKVVFDRIQELIVEDQPVTFLYEATQLVGISRHLRGADINAASTYFNVEDWYWAP